MPQTPEERRARERAYHAANRAKRKAQSRAYKAAHRQQISDSNRAYRQAHHEQLLEKDAVYRARNRLTLNAKARAFRAQHLEADSARGLAYRETHREQLREARQTRYWLAPEIHRARSQAYRAQHPETIRRSTRAWQQANKTKRLATEARRRARQAAAPINDLTAAQWEAIKEHYGHCCVYCGRHLQRLTKDHIIPLSKGGSHTFTNVVPACRSCNSRKKDGSPLVPVQPLLLLAI